MARTGISSNEHSLVHAADLHLVAMDLERTVFDGLSQSRGMSTWACHIHPPFEQRRPYYSSSLQAWNEHRLNLQEE